MAHEKGSQLSKPPALLLFEYTFLYFPPEFIFWRSSEFITTSVGLHIKSKELQTEDCFRKDINTKEKKRREWKWGIATHNETQLGRSFQEKWS